MASNEPNNNQQNAPNDFEVIYQYTRAQALADGVLVDLSEWARETGFVIPVACTQAVWDGYIVPPADTRELGQSERGRAHDVLFLLFHAIRHTNRQGNVLQYEVGFLMEGAKHRTVTLKAICGPGDEAEPVMTIMTPDED